VRNDQQPTPLPRHWGLACLLSATTLVRDGSLLALPYALAEAVDGVLAGRSAAGEPLLVALVAVALGDSLAQLANGWYQAAVTADLRAALIRHALALGVPGTSKFTAGDLLGRLSGSAAAAAGLLPAAVAAVTQTIASVLAFVALGFISPLLPVVLALGVPLGALLARSFVRESSRLVTGYQETLNVIASRLIDALAGIRTIRASGTAGYEANRITEPLARLGELGHAMWRRQAQAQLRVGVLVPAMMLTVLAVTGYGVLHWQLAAGQLLAATGYATLGFGFLANAQGQLALAQARANSARVTDVLAIAPMPEGGQPLPAGDGGLEFRGVTVKAGDRLVLDRLNLSVPGGRSVAVVGGSGSGKSTLAALAGRLIDPDDGEVTLDGVPLPDLTTASLRSAVAYASERPSLFGATVAEAIGPGPAETVAAAAQAAHADGFVARLPAGYQTPLTQAPLSGGEVQRLGLARAIAHGGRLVVLDDATSSLDTVTERLVSAALAEAMPDRTRLIVAHRAATAARADLVAWLADGGVRALAPHAELWRDPDYRGLFGGPVTPVTE
jgi:ATP-binding cassette, subfamily B, bacterial